MRWQQPASRRKVARHPPLSPSTLLCRGLHRDILTRILTVSFPLSICICKVTNVNPFYKISLGFFCGLSYLFNILEQSERWFSKEIRSPSDLTFSTLSFPWFFRKCPSSFRILRNPFKTNRIHPELLIFYLSAHVR